jgi:8-amino-7-oxononanoate synthase
MKAYESYIQELKQLEQEHRLRRLSTAQHDGIYLKEAGKLFFNLSSNDYLGVASDTTLKETFLEQVSPNNFYPSSSSSRLLTGNYQSFDALEQELAHLFQAEAALVFNSGYHMNIGILPAVTDAQTLILADKLVHASLIDGIRLSSAKCIRYRHNDYQQLRHLLEKYHTHYQRIIIVTESIFSMDGDEANLPLLVALKKEFQGVMLYVDEAHAFGVRGAQGLGCVEQYQCISEVDFIVGTFGKALGGVGAYVVCREVIRNYLINKMRSFIFTTALPPNCVEWTRFVLQQLPTWTDRREQLKVKSDQLQQAILAKGYLSPSTSHIIPMIVGKSEEALLRSQQLRSKGFYVLPVRPPTVPTNTSRLRFSMHPLLPQEALNRLIDAL